MCSFIPFDKHCISWYFVGEIIWREHLQPTSSFQIGVRIQKFLLPQHSPSEHPSFHQPKTLHAVQTNNFLYEDCCLLWCQKDSINPRSRSMKERYNKRGKAYVS